MTKFRNALHNEKGFTLIELLVVVIIIGILAAVALPNLMGASEGAREKRLEADYRTFASALEVYYSDSGKYPTQASGNLNAVPGLTSGSKAVLKSIPKDPWGGEYTFTGNDTTYTIDASASAPTDSPSLVTGIVTP